MVQQSELIDRKPTPDEAMGMAWWNCLTERERRQWCDAACSPVPADAWAKWNSRIDGAQKQDLDSGDAPRP